MQYMNFFLKTLICRVDVDKELKNADKNEETSKPKSVESKKTIDIQPASTKGKDI